MKTDFDGNGKADALVTSPWGMGLLSLSNTELRARALSKNGTRLGSWVLNTKENSIELKGDFDGDGKTEVLISSPWGIGILKLVGSNFESVAMLRNGTRAGGWLLNTEDNQFPHALDLDGDGKDEILVASPWGIGIFKYANGNFTSVMEAANGTRFGSWLLNTKDNYFTLAGDFDGDQQKEILITSPWGLGILKYENEQLSSIAMIPDQSDLGDWTLNMETDKFEMAGDFDGDGKEEILVSNGEGIAILKLSGNSLSSRCFHSTGVRIGEWILDSSKDKMNVSGDFDGDGRMEILITNDRGLGILKFNGNTLQSILVADNGTRFGGWRLNTMDNRINYVADFDGDGRDELQFTSPWGIGILELSSTTLNAITMVRNGKKIDSWTLNTDDNDLEAGIGKSYCLIFSHPHWQSSLNNTRDFLKNRGQHVLIDKNGPDGVNTLRELSLNLKAADRLLVILAGHGGTGRRAGDLSREAALTHKIWFEHGSGVTLDQLAPSFERLANKGVDLIVYDASCDAGETVMYAMGEKYLAMSTTSVHAPGLTNTPDPSRIMKLFGKPNRFGLWWSSDYAASLLTSIVPKRFYQKIYRNDNTAINRQSLFYRPAIDYSSILGRSWDLSTRNCYLYQFIYPEKYNELTQEKKDRMTVTTEDFLSKMRERFDAQYASVPALKTILSDSELIEEAARIYTSAYPKPWQTLFGDMDWDVYAQPSKRTKLGTLMTPVAYKEIAGFKRLASDTLQLIEFLEQSYYKQEELLTQIDAKVGETRLYMGIFKEQPTPPAEITDYLIYNRAEEERINELVTSLNNLQFDHRRLFEGHRAIQEPLRLRDLWRHTEQQVHVLSDQLIENETDSPTLNELIADLKARLNVSTIGKEKLHYLLTIVEEAISKAQLNSAAPGDLIKY